MNEYTQEQCNLIARNMTIYGGSFIKNIGAALHHADAVNRVKLAKAFPEDFERYLNF
tara:strand:+ start:14030 stop:14200 length:171 start_codon:yes stop_codon:yes gene_type:complete